jgi:hypothetical protein
VSGFCEHCNKSSDYVQGGEFCEPADRLSAFEEGPAFGAQHEALYMMMIIRYVHAVGSDCYGDG